MAELDYDALQRWADAATPGPWFQGRGNQRFENPREVYSKREPEEEDSHDIATFVWSDEDAEFIAASRSAIPALLDRVRELEAESKRWESDFEREFKEHEYWYERLDTLVYSLASVEEVGEWSSGNDPADQLIDHINAKIQRIGAERDAALSTIAKVEALHTSEGWPLPGGRESKEYCTRCNCRWPCPTIRALGSVPSTGEGNDG